MNSRLLPAWCYRNAPLQPEGVIIHYFSAINVDKPRKYDLDACRRLFLDLNRSRAERRFYMREEPWPKNRMYASAHILIGRMGRVCKLVPFDRQAYHAGYSVLNNRHNCNRWTLGVELAGTKHSGFTNSQYRTLADLLNVWREEWDIPLENIAGHDAVRWRAIQLGGAHAKKYDPSGKADGTGDNFDWGRLYFEMGLGPRASVVPGLS